MFETCYLVEVSISKTNDQPHYYWMLFQNKVADTDEDATDSELADPNAWASLPQDQGKTTEIIDQALQSLPPR